MGTECNSDTTAVNIATEHLTVQYAVVCDTVETSVSFACNSSFMSVDGMACLIPFES